MPSESYMDKITLMNMLILKPKLVTSYLQITSTSRLGLTTVYYYACIQKYGDRVSVLRTGMLTSLHH